MATLATNIQAPQNGLGAFFATWAAKRRQYKVYRNTLKELGQLNEHELKDLGLSRAQIQTFAWQCAYS